MIDEYLENELSGGEFDDEYARGARRRRRATEGYSAPEYEAPGEGSDNPPATPPSTEAVQAANTGVGPVENTGITGMGTPEVFFPSQKQPTPPVFAPIQGFDTGKLSGQTPYDSSEKYSPAAKFFSTYLGGGGTVARNQLGGLVEAARAGGFPNARAVGDDKIDFGDGAGPIDVVTAGGQIWFQNGPDRLDGGAAAGGMAPGSTGGVGGAEAGGQFGGAGGLEALIRQLLMKQTEDDEFAKTTRAGLLGNIESAQTPVDENDPIMAAQKRAFQGEQDRAMAQARETLAARAQFGGAPTGSLDAGVQSLLESGMNARGAHSANLMAERYRQKLDQLQSALQMSAGVLNSDETRELQASIAAIEARLRELGLNQTDTHFYDQLGYLIGNQQSGIDRWLMEYLGR